MTNQPIVSYALGALTALTLGSLSATAEAKDRTFPGSNGRVLVETFANTSTGTTSKTRLVNISTGNSSFYRDNVRRATFSPDGNRIAYYALDDRRIHVSNTDGSGDVAVIPSGPTRTGVLSINWSPDGTKLAFARNRAGTLLFDVYVVSNLSRSTTPTRLTTDDLFTSGSITWAPDSATLAYHAMDSSDGDFEIFFQSASGGAPTQITNNDVDDVEPAWAPNGNGIAFVSGSGTFDMRVHFVTMLNVFGWFAGGVEQIGTTATGIYGATLSWSPDSNKLLALYAFDGPDHVAVLTRQSFMGMSLGWQESILSPDVFDDPLWTPDSRKIIYQDDADWDLSIMDADGRNARKINTANYASVNSVQAR